ncbi:MAG: hypothetical protein Q8K86_11385 [Candidatus Nanopelagicaceae bacterium]|nr:hypothetical protein [Candidatus Nanopelagicaceae bacterium]
MVKKMATRRTEEDRVADDANDPILKMLDGGEMSMQEIFDALGWEPIPIGLFERGEK